MDTNAKMPIELSMSYNFVLEGHYALDIMMNKSFKDSFDYWAGDTPKPKINVTINAYQDGVLINKQSILEVRGQVIKEPDEKYQSGWDIWRFHSPNIIPNGEVLFKIQVDKVDKTISDNFESIAFSISKSFDW